MAVDLKTAHRELWKWCRAQGLAGYDPFDGLNSSFFQALPLRNSRLARLAWTQFHKRSPVNLRPLAGIPRERNAKAMALFALAALADFRRHPTKENETAARELLDDLISMSLKGFSGACWGYNFDWQSRSLFAPRGTPTIVPTAFAARALCEAAEVLARDEYLPFARTTCDFILRDLNRSEETNDELCFSYSPLDRTRVFNASLLAGETLATTGRLLGEASLLEWAQRATRYVVRRQQPDGSWTYGAEPHQAWADNFHTAYILTSLSRIMDAGSKDDLDNTLRRGHEFWAERFFLSNGWPKYYPDRLYPADVHCVAAAIINLLELRGRIPGSLVLARRIADWAFENLFDGRSVFFYQRRRFFKVRIPYMRWSEAWMIYALARLREVTEK